jgi:hypothetical protein
MLSCRDLRGGFTDACLYPTRYTSRVPSRRGCTTIAQRLSVGEQSADEPSPEGTAEIHSHELTYDPLLTQPSLRDSWNGNRSSCAAARGADIAARCPYHAITKRWTILSRASRTEQTPRLHRSQKLLNGCYFVPVRRGRITPLSTLQETEMRPSVSRRSCAHRRYCLTVEVNLVA